jgi:outer membrane protein OmpA-like peptidoglycan-associated protein
LAAPSAPLARAPTAPDPAALAVPGRVTTGGDAGLTPAAVKIATILFANGSSQIDARGQQVLAQVMRLHRQNGGTLRVVGHASSRTRAMDPVRHNMVNYNVSVARANAVARELIRMGARPEKVFAGAVADADPRYYEVMPTGEAGNRRAEVYIDR